MAPRLISESAYIQGRHVSEKVNFQGDDSEIKECGRGCKQLDPSGSAPPHVTALFGGLVTERGPTITGKATKSTRRQSVAYARAI